MCSCQLRLHFLLEIEQRCPRSSKGTASSGGPICPGYFVPSVPKSPASQVLVSFGLPSHPRRPIAETRVNLDRCLQCVPSGMPRSAVGRWTAEWCRCRLARQGLNHTTSERGARGALAHMENVPPRTLAQALHRRPRTPLHLHVVSSRKSRGRVPFPVLLPCTPGDPPAGTTLLLYYCSPPLSTILYIQGNIWIYLNPKLLTLLQVEYVEQKSK